MSVYGETKKDIPVNPGMVHHEQKTDSPAFKGHAVPGNIARDGAPKNHRAVEVHPSMLSRSRHTGRFTWGGHLASYDANPANPLNSGPARGKRLTPVMASPGMKDQTASGFADDISRAALGKKILDEAGDASTLDDRRALGIGTLPDATSEET